MRIAIIDLGTNTCNLLIAEIKGKEFEIIHQSKQLVKLGDSKIRDNLISSDAVARVMAVLESQKQIISSMKAEKIQLIATSAVRTAKNKDDLLQPIGKLMGCPIEVVTGSKEAELIFKGVILALGSLTEKSLILDIGGGSNELIVAYGQKMLWKESKPTGMVRILNQFVLSDPLKPSEIQILQHFFLARHQAAVQRCRKELVNALIGCSGSFDTIADILEQVDPGEKQRQFMEISLSEFYDVFGVLIHSNRKQRMEMKGMDDVRVDLIVPAMVFIDLLIKHAGIAKIIQTGYSLREGALFEMMEARAENL